MPNHTETIQLTREQLEKGARLERLTRSTGWRKVLAQFIAHYMLDPFDPDGVHVK